MNEILLFSITTLSLFLHTAARMANKLFWSLGTYSTCIKITVSAWQPLTIGENMTVPLPVAHTTLLLASHIGIWHGSMSCIHSWWGVICAVVPESAFHVVSAQVFICQCKGGLASLAACVRFSSEDDLLLSLSLSAWFACFIVVFFLVLSVMKWLTPLIFSFSWHVYPCLHIILALQTCPGTLLHPRLT